MSTIKRVLEEKLYQLPLENEVEGEGNISSGQGSSFIRPFDYFIQAEEEARI